MKKAGDSPDATTATTTPVATTPVATTPAASTTSTSGGLGALLS